MSSTLLELPRYQKSIYCLEGYSLLKVSGPDACDYLHSQLSSDIKKIPIKSGQLSTRLTREGHVIAWPYVLRAAADEFFLLQLLSQSMALKTDLEKYIIMEDVTVDEVSYFPYWLTCAEDDELEKAHFDFHFSGTFFGECSWIGLQSKPLQEFFGYKNLTREEFEKSYYLSGLPFSKNKMPVTQTCLVEEAINFSKGCFLGQETVSKIVNNRGAAYYPVLLELKDSVDLDSLKLPLDLFVAGKKRGSVYAVIDWEGQKYFCTELFRELRVEGREIEFTLDEFKDGFKFVASIKYFPFFSGSSGQHKAQELYEVGVHHFQRGREELAKDFLKRAIVFDPSFADAYESLGVIYGRHGDHEKAIELMDQLLLADPDSVMAHTNKSLYFMKMGEIEKAEEEKGLATVAEFKHLGKKAKQDKELKEDKKRKEEQLLERESMFNQVLEIDSEDQIANYGLADIAYFRGDYTRAISFLERVLKSDEKYSTAYVLLGKSYMAINQHQKASEIFEKGIAVATKKGDLMPANEMQSLISKLPK